MKIRLAVLCMLALAAALNGARADDLPPSLSTTCRWLREKLQKDAGFSDEEKVFEYTFNTQVEYYVEEARGRTFRFVMVVRSSGESGGATFCYTKSLDLKNTTLGELKKTTLAGGKVAYDVVLLGNVREEVLGSDGTTAKRMRSSASISFADEAMAKRVVKAFEHAIRLCSEIEDEKEPF